MDKAQAKALADFVAEAEEILESLGDALEASREELEASGKVRPARINKIFRDMHSLKGLASMLGLEKITTLSHQLESFLDKIRMGKEHLSGGVFDLLSESRRILRNLVGEAGRGAEKTSIDAIMEKIELGISAAPAKPTGLSSRIDLDEKTLKAFTEYEEHRLNENIESDVSIFSIQVGFDFSDFDERLRSLTELLNETGEIISTLPVVDPTLTEGIHFRLIYGTEQSEKEVQDMLGGQQAEIRDLRIGSSAQSQTRAPEAPSPHDAGFDEEDSETDADAEEMKGLSDTVKVSIGKLDTVMGILGELNLVQTSLEVLQERVAGVTGQEELAREFRRHVRTMDKKVEELQRAIIDIRLVPIGQIFHRLSRTARKMAREAGKQVSIQLYGGETELDKVMIDELVAPLIHLIRNAIDHGLESAEVRAASGKPAEGMLMIIAYQEGNSISVEVTDDGRGLQLDEIREAAIQKGFIAATAQVSSEELMEVIYQPGFSSARKVTEVSGRGVGLDAVKAAAESMKGNVSVYSEPNKGTTFRLTVPITLAIVQSLIVSCCDQTYAVPIASILESFRISEKEVDWVNQREVYNLRGTTLPLLRLEDRFDLKRDGSKRPEHSFVVVARRGERMAGIVVDALLGEQETVMHPLGARLGNIPGVAGATEIGENQVVLVIDTASLLGVSESVRV
jgi:two-component system, chemotaxis family, sensor kinase CheA